MQHYFITSLKTIEIIKSQHQLAPETPSTSSFEGILSLFLQGQLVCEIIPNILFGGSQIQVVAFAFLPQNFGKVAGTYE